ncbi:MAG: hypothetical protein H0W20_08785, partial [Chthoniobacterales bacterium]|nr:hypothetical protein [Chthoniobacterales bacterium]
YLSNSHADAETQRKFKADFFSWSYAGHYTPFAFLAEFGTAKAFGTNGTLWRLRQLVAVAAIGALLFAATYSTAWPWVLRGSRMAQSRPP